MNDRKGRTSPVSNDSSKWFMPSWLVAGAAVALALASVLVPDAQEIALVGGAILLGSVVALRRGVLDADVVLFVSVVGALILGSHLVSVTLAHSTASDTASSVLALLAAIVLIVGLFGLYRARHDEPVPGIVGDGLIVGLGAAVVAWITLLQPRLDSDGSSVPLLVDGIYHPAAAVVLFLVSLIVFTDRYRQPVIALVAAPVVVAVVADLLLAADRTHRFGGGWATPLANALYIVCFGLVAAALLHPSASTLTVRQASPAGHGSLGRLIVTTSSLSIPFVVLAIARPEGPLDTAVRTVSAVVLAGAVTLRAVQAVQTARVTQSDLIRNAQTDLLTGLPNRALLLSQLNASLHDSWQGSQRPTIYFVDLDRFKTINDSLGHAAGDQVLRSVADRLLLASPYGSMVARLSGDEYVVLDPTSTGEPASIVADRLLEVFREPFTLSQGDVFVTASIGIASISANTRTTAEDLLRHADTAMYRAKDAGRNCMAFYDESMHERVAHRLAVETALYRALDRRELRLYHQPILDLDTGDVVGFEALMRWQQADGTMVSPAEFIPIAEDTGTIIPIGSWALLEALSQLRSWIDDAVCSPSATMSVNVSPRQLADPAFPSIVSEALMRAGVEPRSLWLEITESVMITEPELALATLQKLKSLGVLVALDDFGTGYSSLSLLQRFPLQRIKIDQAFVSGVADSPSDRSLVRTIIAMGTSLGLDLVAEGVESVHQLQVLRELGCHKAQGYLISHPVPPDAMRSTVSALERLGQSPLLRPSPLTTR
jgi:diguanylate cyclase (GGDEF)-like protein